MMGHSYSNLLIHLVFSTKGRTLSLASNVQEQLWPYLGGVASGAQMKALAVGGTDDHVHLLLSIPSSLPVAKAVQTIKGNSSLWIHKTFPGRSDFAWQEGYGAFSIGVSQIDKTAAYIGNQREHHQKISFKEEFLSFLKAHGIEYDEKHVWG
jgi:putative transposase